MRCFQETMIEAFYNHELDFAVEKMLEEHVMTCIDCWQRVMRYDPCPGVRSPAPDDLDIHEVSTPEALEESFGAPLSQEKILV